MHADASTAGTLGDLRWLDPPPDPADPDDVPEFPIAFPRGPAFSVPLGRRFEIAVSLPGLVDPRVAFAGPRSPGERVEIPIARPGPSPRITGRLVGEDGRALAGAEFEAWLEREDARVLPEDDWLVADSDGRFAFDVPPGAGGLLRVELTGASVGPGVSYAFEIGADPARRRSARAELAPRLTASTVDVGDLECRADP